MLSTVDLTLFPSCFNALAWSPDGDLAAAVGEYIHIVVPKNSDQESRASQGPDGWHTTRIRVNAFTNAEAALVFPQGRDDFSIAAEQSTSTVIGLSWSPPGLARFRRSVLAVLTSNLVLSLWEPVGEKRQWARVSIINHALHPNPDLPSELEGLELRKANIRSFSWCSPIRLPARANGSNEPPEPESRWGAHMLTVANDANEMKMVQVRRASAGHSPAQSYHVEILATQPLGENEELFPHACPGSILRTALQSKTRATSISCGPWIALENQEHVYSATSVIAAVYGTRLRFIKATVALGESDSERKLIPRYEITAELRDHPLAGSDSKWTHYRITGPLQWLHSEHSPAIALAAGIVGGWLTIFIPRAVYDGHAANTDQVEAQSRLFSSFTTEDGELPNRHMEPLSAVTTTRDESNGDCFLHLGTIGGLGAVASFDQLATNDSPGVPRWHRVTEELLDQFDLNRDLGGHAVARIWGLASYRRMTAVLFTRHPTDMVEYQLASSDGTTVGFVTEQPSDAQSPEQHDSADKPARVDHAQWKAAIAFLLSGSGACYENDAVNQQLVYTAACCALMGGQDETIRTQARQSFERLAAITGADLSEEMANCNVEAPIVSPKTTEQLSGPGAHLFERCEICEAGITWFSATEAQCANGHLFVRCGLSFLAIQEPGLSKYCSTCRTEYLDEEVIAAMQDRQLSPLFMKLFEAFDTCLYCDGKFQSSI